ncbi:MAG: hypothetical protein P8R42_17530 [Candidatus Binatia bacterium]|nr:hypothetical protein [Candidatus Binatia bacterium]
MRDDHVAARPPRESSALARNAGLADRVLLDLLVRQLGFIRDLGRADKVGQSRVIVRLPA